MVGSLRRMHYDILRYIRALYDKIWNAKRQNHRAKVHNLQVLPPNKKKCEPAQAFLRSNPRWIWPSPPAELLLKVCALVFEVSWVLTQQGVEFIWSVLMHRCKQNHAQTDTRNRVCVCSKEIYRSCKCGKKCKRTQMHTWKYAHYTNNIWWSISLHIKPIFPNIN